MVNFLTQITDCDSHSPALLDLLLLMLVFVPQWLSLHWEILLSQFPLTFYQTHNDMLHFIAYLTAIPVLIGKVFVNIWEKFHERISLNSVLLLLVVNFMSGFRLELMYISLNVRIRSSFTHLHGIQLLTVHELKPKVGSFWPKIEVFTDQNEPKGGPKMKINFEYLQIQKWMLQLAWKKEMEKMGSFV